VNAFTSVSLDPPLVLVSIDRRTKGCDLLSEAPFAVNVLHEGQRDVALHFAGRPQASLSLEWEEGKLAPRLVGCLAYLECEPWQAYDGGDHVLFLGQVHSLEHREGNPLVFYTGRFHELGRAYDLPWLESLDCPTAGWLGQLPADARRADR
jgi:flavin reductase (DIM6/NTAB) family NADH-FMN oxidoreductase RutF